MGRYRDRFYPYIFGFIAFIISFLLKLNPTIKGFDNVLDGTISFSSIMLGFIAALLAIILSISNSPVMKHLYNYVENGGNITGKDILFSYFRVSIFSGFIAVIISIYMFIICQKNSINMYDKIVSYCWSGITVFFICSSYRIVSILMHALFKHHSHELSNYEQTTEPLGDYEELKKRNIRNQN